MECPDHGNISPSCSVCADEEIDLANKRVEELKLAYAKRNEEICQVLGKALGHYPWFCDDQKTSPDLQKKMEYV